MTKSTYAHRSHIEHDSVSERNRQSSIVNFQLVKDTVFVLDSVQLETRHDTIYHTRWRTEFRDRLVEKIDTVIICDMLRMDIRSQTFAMDSIMIAEKNVPSCGERKQVVPSWCWWLLAINVVVVICVFLRKFRFLF